MLTRDVLDASGTYAQDKMEAFTAVFSRLSDLGVEQIGPYRPKTALSIFFDSISIDRTCRGASSLRVIIVK